MSYLGFYRLHDISDICPDHGAKHLVGREVTVDCDVNSEGIVPRMHRTPHWKGLFYNVALVCPGDYTRIDDTHYGWPADRVQWIKLVHQLRCGLQGVTKDGSDVRPDGQHFFGPTAQSVLELCAKTYYAGFGTCSGCSRRPITVWNPDTLDELIQEGLLYLEEEEEEVA